jgi:hypothetical protein
MNYYLLLIISSSTLLTITFFSSFVNAFGQLEVEIPTKFSTFTNEEYGIQLEYPSDWQIFEDRVPGDYVIDIAVFVPSSEINFKEYNSYKDFKKMDTRVLVFLDYSFFIPKLNLNFALDSAINANMDTQSEGYLRF